MESILSVTNLTYKIGEQVFFHNFNLEVKEKTFTSIIAPNKSGKTMLTKLLCAIIPTTDNIFVDNISLNKENVLEYITKIGIVTNDLKNPFLFKTVREELSYPLDNLGYTDYKIQKRIIKLIDFFECGNLLDKEIKDLKREEKAKILIILALLHHPKLLILDDAFCYLNNKEKELLIEKLILLKEEGLTILNITSQLDTIYKSDVVMVLNNFKIENTGDVIQILEMDSYLNKIGLEIPFVVDLSIKLKFYGLLDKICFNLEDLEDYLWK